MHNQYNSFFRGLKDFVVRYNLANEAEDKSFKGGAFTTERILNEKEINLSIKNYLKYFGTQIAFKNNGLGSAFFDLESMLNCAKMAKEKNVERKILEVKFVDGWEKKEVHFDGERLLFLKYDAVSSSYLFVTTSAENPVLYIYWEGGEITSDNIRFTSFVRDILF